MARLIFSFLISSARICSFVSPCDVLADDVLEAIVDASMGKYGSSIRLSPAPLAI
jgi:hypothetical protein